MLQFVFTKAVEFTRKMTSTEPLKSIIEGKGNSRAVSTILIVTHSGPILPDATVQTEDDFTNYINTLSQSE